MTAVSGSAGRRLDPSTAELFDRMRAGSRLALSRLISIVENGGHAAGDVASAAYASTGRAHVVGVTGPSGSGKSTLVTQVAKAYRERDVKVGVVAVDPTSPFSGGAVLGDRVRMQELSGDPGIFIRSMASRGTLGGLARATGHVARLLDAAGYQKVLIETVGAGQTEVNLAQVAHTIVVLHTPGAGDEIQMIKAGLLEIGDIYAVNKADVPGADTAVTQLRVVLNTGTSERWRRPVLKTVAIDGSGVEELVAIIESHLGFLRETGALRFRERRQVEMELRRLLSERLVEGFIERIPADIWRKAVERLVDRSADPYTVAEELHSHQLPSKNAGTLKEEGATSSPA